MPTTHGRQQQGAPIPGPQRQAADASRSRAEVLGGIFDTTYDLKALASGTRFIHTNGVRWSGGMRVMRPVQKVMTKRIMDRQLRALKTILEAQII